MLSKLPKYMLYFSVFSILIIALFYKTVGAQGMKFLPSVYAVFLLVNVVFYFLEMRSSQNLKVPTSYSRFLAISSGVHNVATFVSLATLEDQINEVQSQIPLFATIFIAILFIFFGGYFGFYFSVFVIRPSFQMRWKDRDD